MNNEIIKYYWSREVGKFVNKLTGEEVKFPTGTGGPAFNFSAFEWYQTLFETIVDVTDEYYKKTFKNGNGKQVNKIIVSRDGLCFIECLLQYKLNLENEWSGTLQNRFTVYLEKKEDSINIIDLYSDDELAGHVVILDCNFI